MALAIAQKSSFFKACSGFSYDVFLSFRGEDTRKTFTDHLYTALVQAGFRTFRDDPELERGENIKQKLEEAIQQSQSSVIVFSKDYTSSRWCLDELVIILERKRTSDHVVLPVFYDVEPSDVRKQAENLAKVPKYQENQSTEKLNGWRVALRDVADLAGMVLPNEADGHESKFIQNVVREIQDKLGRRVPLGVVQEILHKKLLYVNSVLDVAEGKKLNNPAVKDWFNDLKEAAYDAEDLLQEIKTEALRREMEAESAGSSTSTVQELVSSPPPHAFDSAFIIFKAEEVLERLEDIVKQKKKYQGLEASAGHKRLQQARTRETSSFLDDSAVYGRDQDKEAIVKLLLSNDDDAGKKISVIPIIGMGGIGKTTLAQLVYNDIRVKQHFKLQAWVCVSVESDVIKITQTIYESVYSKTCRIRQLDLLQIKLKEKLMMKKFLLVLDNVWNENYMDWQDLRKPLESGAIGSKIIVTTRNQGVANVMHTDIPSHHLMQISDEDCWLLFAKHAYGNADLLNSQYPDLASIGRQIATKCKGLPLAAKSLGGLLRSELNVAEWVEILESEIWELSEKKTNILPALWLSYYYLPLHLKPCFAYCAIFPKGYYFTKLELVLSWMAQDLLQPKKKKMIEVGDAYFNDLISRSFFQSSPTSELDSLGDSKFRFTMHDLINDLAKFVSGDFCFRLEDQNSSNFVSKTRHFSYKLKRNDGADGFPNFEALRKAKSLRTFLKFEKGYMFPNYLCPASNWLGLFDLKCLRLLDLSCYDARELPDLIGNLKHLKYLDLSRSSIEKLPDALCTLYNLQTLLLSGCEALVELPTKLGRLIKLEHVDISGTKIEKMPQDMGKLKDLHFLSDFVLDSDTGHNIVELKELQHLHKRLCISGLNNIVCEGDVKEANVSGMKYLEKLVLKWVGDTNDSVPDRQVLERLQPHANLKLLRIESYRGTSFPNWLGDHSFSNLSSVVLVDCKFCLSFPPLGQLPSLEELHIGGFQVTSIGLEFYGCGVKPFRSLKALSFVYMLEWQEWSNDVLGNHEEEGGIFPNLWKLTLHGCPKLTKMFPLDKFPKLEWLNLSGLNSFTNFSLSQESNLLSLSRLIIVGCPKFECFPARGIDAPNLKNMSILYCEKFRSLPEGMHSLIPSLEELTIFGCPELESFPQGGLPPSLVELHFHCKEKLFANRTQWGLQRLNSLTALVIDRGVFSVFPEEALLPTSLTFLRISECPNLTTLDGKALRNLDSLRILTISGCPELQCLPEEGLPASLSALNIYECPLLERRLQREEGEDWPKIAHIPTISSHPYYMVCDLDACMPFLTVPERENVGDWPQIVDVPAIWTDDREI